MEIKTKMELRNRLNEILEEESDEVAKLAVDNQFVGFADGVVQLDMDSGEIFGAPFTQGTLENPENPFVEIYRLSQRFNPRDICNDCYGCTLLEGETEEDVFNDCLLEAIKEDFRDYFDERAILDCLEIGEII
jgi:hypothetical protein